MKGVEGRDLLRRRLEILLNWVRKDRISTFEVKTSKIVGFFFWQGMFVYITSMVKVRCVFGEVMFVFVLYVVK